MSATAGERPQAGQLSAGRLGAGRYLAAGSRPESAVTSVHELTTADGATVRGVLATVPGARTVVGLMHPRQDLTHHPLVPPLLRAGAAVWTQHTRSVNNDLSLLHEQALLDVAAGLVFHGRGCCASVADESAREAAMAAIAIRRSGKSIRSPAQKFPDVSNISKS